MSLRQVFRALGSLPLGFVLVWVVGCGDEDPDEKGSNGTGGGGRGGAITLGGTSGTASSGGTSSGGTTSSGGSSTGGSSVGGSGAASGGTQAGDSGGQGASGTQPIGAICANDGNCSQANGDAICCPGEGCVGPCVCLLSEDCPGGSSYLPCESEMDCERFGGGKVCCAIGDMHFCTKPSACSGQRLP